MSTTIADLRTRLEAFLAGKLQAEVRITEARRLTGGASRDTWAVDVEIAGGREAGRHALILRRDLGGVIHEDALSREQEFRVLETAHRHGILVPRPRWCCRDAAVLGTPFFLMERLEGESVGRRVVREASLAEARRVLPVQIAEQLARIHSIAWEKENLGFLPQPTPGMSPALTALEHSEAQLRRLEEPHPALELAIRWLRRRAPACTSLVLVHGDFRIGNLMVGSEGLRGIFDWEFAHVGDPMEDVAWPLVRSWRFGHDNLKLGGIGQPDEFFAAYERCSGRTVNRTAVRYWEILGNLRWAIGCMVQAQRHLSGQAPSIELASLGRRTAEMELELLALIEKALSEPEAEDTP
jgi:aminoglycoside phosphotransferase (APT) family kinase protein